MKIINKKINLTDLLDKQVYKKDIIYLLKIMYIGHQIHLNLMIQNHQRQKALLKNPLQKTLKTNWIT